jgi:hypothetical protein
MNRWDSMLAWLSTQPEHKWVNVKASSMRLSAVEPPQRELTPYGHAMRWVGPLIRLGHSEFDPCQRTVSAIPPGLLRNASRGFAACYGYWDPLRLRVLRRIGLKRFHHSPERGPSCWAVRGASAQIVELGEQANVWVADDPSFAFLSRLPVLQSLLCNLQPVAVATKGRWEKYDFRRNHFGMWHQCKQFPSAAGLYRHRESQTVQVYLDGDLRAFKLETVDEKTAAKWSCYQSRLDWVYSPDTRRLLVPYGTPELPVLVSRGLTTQSARLPIRLDFDNARWWRYDSVDQPQAEQAARIMEQELTVRNVTNV